MQGTAADIAMETVSLLQDKLPALAGSTRLILQIHDEFILETDDEPDCFQAAETCLRQAMEDGFQTVLNTKLIHQLCDIKCGYSWAEIH